MILIKNINNFKLDEEEKSFVGKKSRKIQVTINNPKEHGYNIEKPADLIIFYGILIKKWNIIYMCVCEEIGLGENHMVHIHIYFEVQNPINFSAIKKVFPSAHIEFCKASSQENRDYVYKEGKYLNDEKRAEFLEGYQLEIGELPKEREEKAKENQGKRTDLIKLKDLIKAGMSNAEIYDIDIKYLKYANIIDKIRQDFLVEKFASEWRNVEVTYIQGVTGTGKTRGIMDKYGYKNVCRVKKDDYGFNSYIAQDVVIFEEFRNTFKIEDMLDYLDGYPSEGRALFGKRQLGYTKAFICSNWKLEEQYKSIQEEHPTTWQAFLRRINKIILKDFDKEVIYYQKNRGTKENPDYDFINDNGISYFDPFGLKKWGEDKKEEPKTEEQKPKTEEPKKEINLLNYCDDFYYNDNSDFFN